MSDASDGDDPQAWESWLWALVDENLSWCVTLIHDIEPAEALARSIAEVDVYEGSWRDARALAEQYGDQRDEDALPRGTVVGAFRIGNHTLLVDDGTRDRYRPALSTGTFAASSFNSINGETSLLVYRDGDLVTEINDDSTNDDALISADVLDVLTQMGSDDPVDTAMSRDLELFGRVAGVLVTVADVSGPCRYAVDSDPWPANP